MKKIISVFCILLVATSLLLVSCKKEGAAVSKSIVMMQNKPEIDAQLKEYAAEWSQKNGVETTIKSIGGSSSVTLGQQLQLDFAAGDMPDIFVIAGPEDYRDWENIILDQSNEAWVKETSVAYKVNGMVVGFPVAVEGWGMAYNADILKAAGVDPAKLTNLKAYQDAFATIDAQKAGFRSGQCCFHGCKCRYGLGNCSPQL
jgi:raffinose/stachyose/melibiose transport system substrate-binding protein